MFSSLFIADIEPMQVHRLFIFYLNIFLLLGNLRQQPSFLSLLIILTKPEWRHPTKLGTLGLLLRLLFDTFLSLPLPIFIL